MTPISAAIAAVWMAGFWALSRDRSNTWPIALIGMVASLLTVGLAAAQLWPAMQAGYPGDSYWTLGLTGRLGVAAISASGVTLLFALLTLKTRIILALKRQATGTAWAIIDMAAGLALFAVGFSAAPQVFYTFYRMIIPDLPQQWVIKGWVDWDRLSGIARLSSDAALADHTAGITLWSIIPFTLWLHLRHWWRGG